jgi:hypothetical protein
MGLDQYAYSKNSEGEEAELAYWRKHNRLQGWMEDLWEAKGRPNYEPTDNGALGDFNCVNLYLDMEDLDDLEEAVCAKALPLCGGFFFGEDSFSWEDKDGEQHKGYDYFYKELDMQFIEKARDEINKGKEVFYTCWW